MKTNMKQKRVILKLIICIILLISSNVFIAFVSAQQKNINSSPDFCIDLQKTITPQRETRYQVPTIDNSSITLFHYKGQKSSIILIHGMAVNHRIFDWDDDHSLAKYLQNEGWDVWLLNLRTHDADGDFLFHLFSDREQINRYWDFDNTLLKIDVKTAVDYVKKQTDNKKIILGGHSYGGYLAYAYALLIGEENLSGIITSGASPYANPSHFQPSFLEMRQYGYYIGKKAYVNPIGKIRTHFSLISSIKYSLLFKPSANAIFYYNTTSEDIQKKIIFTADDEAAGVYVDMHFGKNPHKYNGHWVDPQTLYDYSKNLNKITVPILFIAGDEDTQDPSTDIYKAYQRVGSKEKYFYSFPAHSHLDLLLSEDASTLIFPKIVLFLDKIENEQKKTTKILI